SDCANQNPNSGVGRLMIDLQAQDSGALQTITVLFENATGNADNTVIPLSEWRLKATLSNNAR
uniref:hypothetical protein n=1 Tax=uncultured Ruegeria sp. TaxID=259304 RepID=UPI0026164F00